MIKNFTTIFVFLLFLIFIFQKPVTAANSFYSYDARSNNFNTFKFNIERGCPNCNINDPQSGYPYKSFSQLIIDYDTLVFVQSVQGLVNRQGPNLYIVSQDSDQNWLDALRQQNIWLSNYQTNNLTSLAQLIQTFKTGYDIRGSVVWTSEKPYTLNLAITVAGAENLVIVRKDSALYSDITNAFPVQKDLSTFNFTSKKSGYEWLTNNYLLPEKVNPIVGFNKDGYPVKNMLEGKLFPSSIQGDGWGLAILNLYIKSKAFVVDLAPDARIIPIDEPGQPPGEDRRTFESVLNSARSLVPNSSMLEFWGFPSRKYLSVDCNGDGIINEGDFVACGEWSTQHLISEKGTVMRVGANDMFGVELANGSFYEFGPKADFIPQGTPLTPSQLVQKGYLSGDPNNPDSLQVNPNIKFALFYMGDYDMSVPFYAAFQRPDITSWTTKSSGLPVAWGFGGGDAKLHIPPLYNYFAKSALPSDYFVMPDSGNGYLNPGLIPDQYTNTWVKESTTMNRELGYRLGWVLNGDGWPDVPADNDTGRKIRNMYKVIAPEGIFFNATPGYTNLFVDGGMAVLPMQDLTWAGRSETDAANDLRSFTNNANQFYVFRNIYVNPDYLTRIISQANIPNFVSVDPLTFMYLFKLKTARQLPSMRPTVISENIPSQVSPGQTANVTMRVRNDGWDTWLPVTGSSCDQSATFAQGCHRIAWTLQAGNIDPSGPGKLPSVDYSQRMELGKTVSPGESVDLSFTITMPNNVGAYTFQTDIVKELYYWGEYLGNQPWQKKIQVMTAAKTCSLSLSSSSITTNQSITVNFSGNNNNSTNPNAPVNFMLEKSDFTQIPGGIGTELAYTPPGGNTQYFYKLKTCTSSGNTPCSDSATVGNLPLGNYYLHCDVFVAPNACSGQPACSYNGGPDDCTGVSVRCGSSDHVSLNVNANPPTLTPIPPTSTPVPTSTPIPPSPTPTSIPGDITGPSGVPDGVVNIYDYNKLIGDFGKTGSPGFTLSDIDKNGKVDIYDYNTLVGNFGRGNQ